jgi:hypothetical protein
MRAEHHDLVSFVGAADFPHDVEHRRVGMVGVLDIRFDRDGDVFRKNSRHAAVLLGGNRDRRECLLGVGGGAAADRIDAVAPRRRRQ